MAAEEVKCLLFVDVMTAIRIPLARSMKGAAPEGGG
jgi:hypothetical protein